MNTATGSRRLLDISDLSTSELRGVLDLARRPVEALGAPLRGQGAALIFEKPSTRTRHSMEIAVVQLGGHPVYTRGEEVGLDVRESVEDVARTLSGYHGVIAARVFRHGVVRRLADAATAPVVNMLSDHSHPLQAFADVLTMETDLGSLRSRTVAWIGDYNNVARSLAEACAMLGANIRIGCPPGYGPDPAELDRLAALGAASVVEVAGAKDAADGADAVHTDVWTSMGQEEEAARRRAAFESFTVDDAVMDAAAPGAIFLHCLPAHRGEEVAASVIDGPRSRVVPQAHNRLHAARAALAFVLGAGPR